MRSVLTNEIKITDRLSSVNKMFSGQENLALVTPWGDFKLSLFKQHSSDSSQTLLCQLMVLCLDDSISTMLSKSVSPKVKLKFLF